MTNHMKALVKARAEKAFGWNEYLCQNRVRTKC